MISILVVDDDEDLLEMTAIMLRTNKFEVQTLSEGMRIFERLDADRPDIIILDVYLGDSDGRELCRRIKNNDKIAGIPVLLYSAVNIPEDSILASGADGFLQKPFNMSDMVERVRALVK